MEQIFKNNKNHYLILSGIIFLYITMSSSAITDNQMVYGEMQSHYIFQRLADGLILYQDIIPLYGPVFYEIGTILQLFGISYTGFKIVMLGVAILSGLLVFLITKQVFKNYNLALVATGIYIFLPIHYGVAPVFHPDSFAVLLFLASLLFLIKNTKISFIVAGIISVSAIFVKIPVLPLVIVPIIYFVIYRKKIGIYYIVPFLVISIIVFILILELNENLDNTKFIVDSLLNNPDNPLNILRDFIWIEGLAFLLAVVGFFIYLKNKEKNKLLVFFSIASLLPVAAILLPGVGIYEANYIEPFIAIFAAFLIFYVMENWKWKKINKKIIPIILLSLVIIQISIFTWPDRERIADWDGDRWAFQLNEVADGHSLLLEKYTKNGDLVVASSMAAFRTERILPFENPYQDLLKIKSGFNYKSSINEIEGIYSLLENKKIKMLISFNSTERNDKKYSELQNNLFFPYYTDSFVKIIDENYEKHSENGFNYFIPKS